MKSTYDSVDENNIDVSMKGTPQSNVPDFKPSMKKIFEVGYETITPEEFEKREQARKNSVKIKRNKKGKK